MAANENPEITDAEFAQFQKLIYKIAGISLADSKKVLLVGRLGRGGSTTGFPASASTTAWSPAVTTPANCRPWSIC
jgi:hypothetical protein